MFSEESKIRSREVKGLNRDLKNSVYVEGVGYIDYNTYYAATRD